MIFFPPSENCFSVFLTCTVDDTLQHIACLRWGIKRKRKVAISDAVKKKKKSLIGNKWYVHTIIYVYNRWKHRTRIEEYCGEKNRIL